MSRLGAFIAADIIVFNAVAENSSELVHGAVAVRLRAAGSRNMYISSVHHLLEKFGGDLLGLL